VSTRCYIPEDSKEHFIFREPRFSASKEVTTMLSENEVNVDPITLDELLLSLKSFKNKEHQGQMK
jgi:hypothetical protein